MNDQSYHDEVLLSSIKELSNWISQRFTLQEELKLARAKAPKSEKVIEKKLKQIRCLSQDILDRALYIKRQQPTDHTLNRKRWAVLRELFEAEEKQLNGLCASPTLALSIITDWKKEPTIKETQQ
ncbi:hypothetical protein [Commensalibacter nepenthis]|uniref:Uncharacterized protein n=1 Tax=Commensalibacter nepenthis TaxID=3043872 RepID=A0ABT6QAK2_9PROT|nr:hypothetical protein [Commensalibacter sp. TBRC 10068]MDI2113934.1 hypothetical protein [Commensalibacter sp. TBRC 10068]